MFFSRSKYQTWKKHFVSVGSGGGGGGELRCETCEVGEGGGEEKETGR